MAALLPWVNIVFMHPWEAAWLIFLGPMARAHPPCTRTAALTDSVARGLDRPRSEFQVQVLLPTSSPTFLQALRGGVVLSLLGVMLCTTTKWHHLCEEGMTGFIGGPGLVRVHVAHPRPSPPHTRARARVTGSYIHAGTRTVPAAQSSERAGRRFTHPEPRRVDGSVPGARATMVLITPSLRAAAAAGADKDEKQLAGLSHEGAAAAAAPSPWDLKANNHGW